MGKMKTDVVDSKEMFKNVCGVRGSGAKHPVDGAETHRHCRQKSEDKVASWALPDFDKKEAAMRKMLSILLFG